MRRPVVLVLCAVVLASCAQATEEDRKALIGLWKPEDGTTRTIEFKPDGVFDYKYFATWRLRWELGRKGRVYLKGFDGTAFKTCYYNIESDRLTIDNGSGETCATPAATPPNPMPRSFRRVS